MKLALCTISYRHHLRSFNDLIDFASEEHFDAIDIWGVHAEHLRTEEVERLKSSHLNVSMLSHYLNLDAPMSELLAETKRLSRLATRIGTERIRIFAGNEASHTLSDAKWDQLVYRLKGICRVLDSAGQRLLLEFHPNTATDTVETTIRLLQAINHPACRINFDVLHVIESKADPVEAYFRLASYVDHLHLKTVANVDQFSVFEPTNVYAASGSREGMVPLFEGIVDYHQFFEDVSGHLDHLTASLEWFGPDPDKRLKSDRLLIVQALERVPVLSK
ncbi:sugar phosphate isomerase/epimerase [Exiguobacterium sp. JMULE1]|uniref:sugar phosphate isomerase/epimerase family protein n=1 Tax=Exiguobacterium sp. JMULE1 TaxID=2518339 RepID=UPI001576C367|nr:TIM barrel protein [Exiguobacterium sp. JMULE1]